jgi:hypothetical protein
MTVHQDIKKAFITRDTWTISELQKLFPDTPRSTIVTSIRRLIKEERFVIALPYNPDGSKSYRRSDLKAPEALKSGGAAAPVAAFVSKESADIWGFLNSITNSSAPNLQTFIYSLGHAVLGNDPAELKDARKTLEEYYEISEAGDVKLLLNDRELWKLGSLKKILYANHTPRELAELGLKIFAVDYTFKKYAGEV